MMRKVIGAFLVGVLLIPATVAVAHHGGLHRGVYRQVDGPTWMPSRVIIRCEGWAEDSARLRLVEFSSDRVVYRCVSP